MIRLYKARKNEGPTWILHDGQRTWQASHVHIRCPGETKSDGDEFGIASHIVAFNAVVEWHGTVATLWPLEKYEKGNSQKTSDAVGPSQC